MKKSNRKSVGFAALLIIIGAAVGVIGMMFPTNPIDEFGGSVAKWASRQDASIQSAIRYLTNLGDGWVVAALGTLSVVMSALKFGGKGKRLAVPVTGMAGVWLLNELIKILVSRERPGIPWLIENASGHSFPSGHAMNSMGCYMVMAMTLPARYRRPAKMLALILSLGIGMSRVALGVHYQTDVISGWCFGLAFAECYKFILSSKWVRKGITAAGKYSGNM